MSKLINVSNDVYEELKARKGSGSYSMMIRSMLAKKSNKEKILAFAGKIDFDEKKLKELKRGWKKWSKTYV